MTAAAIVLPLRQRRARDAAWEDFFAWCRGRRLKPLPAHPWTVAAYVRWCEGRRRVRTIPSALDAIAERHMRRALARPDRSIVVRRTLHAVAAGVPRKREAAALFRAEDFLALEAESSPPAPPAEAQARERGAADESNSPNVRVLPESQKTRSLRESKVRALRESSKVRALRTTPRLVPRRRLDS